MNFTNQLAEQVIYLYGLRRTARYRWKAAGEIPYMYVTNGFLKPKPFTKAQKKQQRAFIIIITHPLILHAAFFDSVFFAVNWLKCFHYGKEQFLPEVQTELPYRSPVMMSSKTGCHETH